MSPPHARPGDGLRHPYRDTLTNPEIVDELKAIHATLGDHGAELKAIHEPLDRIGGHVYEGFVSLGGSLADVKSLLVAIRDRPPPHADAHVEASP